MAVDGAEGRWTGLSGAAIPPTPHSAAECVTSLEMLTALASHWSHALDGLRSAIRLYGGSAAGVSFDVACQRAEQAFLQMEVTLRDLHATEGYTQGRRWP